GEAPPSQQVERGEVVLHQLEALFHDASHVQPYLVERFRNGRIERIAPISRAGAGRRNLQLPGFRKWGRGVNRTDPKSGPDTTLFDVRCQLGHVRKLVVPTVPRSDDAARRFPPLI